jgi:hypothetical protein
VWRETGLSRESGKSRNKELRMQLQEILEKYAQTIEEQRRVLETTDVWANRFFKQLDDIRTLISQDRELRGCARIDIRPEIETLSPKDLRWTGSLRVEHLSIDFIYARQTRYSDMGIPAGKEPRLCTRLLGLQYDVERTVRPVVSPRLVVNLFEDNWVARIDPFQQPVIEKSGMTDDFEDLLPTFLEAALLRNRYHPDLSWPAAESMRPMQADNSSLEPAAEIKNLVEESLYGAARADSSGLLRNSEMLHLLPCLR